MRPVDHEALHVILALLDEKGMSWQQLVGNIPLNLAGVPLPEELTELQARVVIEWLSDKSEMA